MKTTYLVILLALLSINAFGAEVSFDFLFPTNEESFKLWDIQSTNTADIGSSQTNLELVIKELIPGCFQWGYIDNHSNYFPHPTMGTNIIANPAFITPPKEIRLNYDTNLFMHPSGMGPSLIKISAFQKAQKKWLDAYRDYKRKRKVANNVLEKYGAERGASHH